MLDHGREKRPVGRGRRPTLRMEALEVGDEEHRLHPRLRRHSGASTRGSAACRRCRSRRRRQGLPARSRTRSRVPPALASAGPVSFAPPRRWPTAPDAEARAHATAAAERSACHRRAVPRGRCRPVFLRSLEGAASTPTASSPPRARGPMGVWLRGPGCAPQLLPGSHTGCRLAGAVGACRAQVVTATGGVSTRSRSPLTPALAAQCAQQYQCPAASRP
jgi:hypothetical protein